MNIICWLIDHSWRKEGAQRIIRCRRCREQSYESSTLFDFFRDRRIGERLRGAAKRTRVWFRSRPCWFKDHDWSPVSERCRRCKQTGIEVAEQGEWTWPVWKRLLKPWLRDSFGVVKRRPQDQVYAVFARSWNFGVERSTVVIGSEKYLTRYIAYLGPICLRLHKFYRGDDDRASHTHPWPFITFPFTSYVEHVYKEGTFVEERVVKKFRFHYRGADFEHIVKGPMWSLGGNDIYYDGAPVYSNEPPFDPFYTFVITLRPLNRAWGFYPKPGEFIYWRDYK